MNEEAIAQAAGRIGKLVSLSHKVSWDPDDVSETPLGLDEQEKLALARILSLIYWSDRSGQVSLARMASALEGEAWRRGFPPAGDVLAHLREVSVEYLLCQRDDEVRHGRALETLMRVHGLEINQPTPMHAYVLSRLAHASDFDEKLVLIHWLIEVFAKILFDELRQRCPDTAVATAMDRIIADESRHVAFGDFFIPLRCQTAAPSQLASVVLTQITGTFVMSGAFWLDGFQDAARVLGMDVRRFFLKGLDALERRYNQYGRPLVILNLPPLARPLLNLLG